MMLLFDPSERCLDATSAKSVLRARLRLATFAEVQWGPSVRVGSYLRDVAGVVSGEEMR